LATHLRGIGWSGLAVALGASVAWSCASGGTDDTSTDGGVGTTDSGSTSDAFVLGDAQPSPPNGDDSGNTTGDDSGVTSGDDDDSGSTTGDDDDSGSTTGDDSGQAVDAGHDAGQTVDSGCGSVAVVVNEVQTTGVSSGSDEWVELFNPSSCAIDITGWKLKYLASAGTSATTLWTAASGTLPALGYAVVAGSAYTGSATPIGTLSNGLAEAGGGVGLYDSSATLLDSVGYGDATNSYVETSAASAPSAGQSIARTPNGTDTNDNATNFAIATTPTPGAKN